MRSKFQVEFVGAKNWNVLGTQHDDYYDLSTVENCLMLEELLYCSGWIGKVYSS